MKRDIRSSHSVNARKLLLAVSGVLLVSGALTGCGKLGPLDQPPPLFGAQAKADYQAKKKADAEAKAAKDAAQRQPVNANALADQPDPQIDNAPKTKRDIQDPNQKLTPLSAAPVDGSPNLMGAPVSTRPPN